MRYEIGQYSQLTQAGTVVYGRRLGPFRSLRSAASELKKWRKTGVDCTVLDEQDNDVTEQAFEQIRQWRDHHAS